MSQRIRVVALGKRNRAEYHDRILELEKGVSYPLGNDRFELDHGEDYFAFFDRIGSLHYFAALDGDRVVAVGAGIVRKVAFRADSKPRRCWYACDVKVHRDYRGSRIPMQMFIKAFPINYLRCPRGYGISMNPGDGSPNRAVKVFQQFPFIPIGADHTIGIVSLDAEQMRKAHPILESHRGPVTYLSLGGVKDIILQSTGQPMPLLHAQFGPCAEAGHPTPRDDSVHMFCAPLGDPLLQEVAALGFEPSSTATIVEHRMQPCDWRFVLTSDI